MLLEISSLRKTYPEAGREIVVLDGIDMTMAAGETVALTGESGSGKSTLLHLIGGLDSADSGSIRIDGHEITGMTDPDRAELRRSTVSVVFQQFNLIPSLTIEQNIAFQARVAGKFDPNHAEFVVNRLGLTGQIGKYPENLSGGQQQRVAIARTLVARPSLILADEPTGNLDETTADDVLGLMVELSQSQGAGLLMVTHSERLADRLGRRLHLSRGRIT